MDRDRFLQRVAAGLHCSGTRDDAPSPPFVAPPTAYPDDRAGMIRLFTDRLCELGGAALLVPDRATALAATAEAMRATGAATIACPPGLKWAGIEEKWTVDPRVADFGLSEADWGIAETGTVVLRHHGERGRGYSLVPPAAGFLLPVSRLVPRLGAVLRAVHQETDGPPACITFISGPSHSGDIAGIFCTGVHGPGDVRVWLIDDE